MTKRTPKSQWPPEIALPAWFCDIQDRPRCTPIEKTQHPLSGLESRTRSRSLLRSNFTSRAVRTRLRRSSPGPYPTYTDLPASSPYDYQDECAKSIRQLDSSHGVWQFLFTTLTPRFLFTTLTLPSSATQSVLGGCFIAANRRGFGTLVGCTSAPASKKLFMHSVSSKLPTPQSLPDYRRRRRNFAVGAVLRSRHKKKPSISSLGRIRTALRRVG